MSTEQLHEELIRWLGTSPIWEFRHKYRSGRLYRLRGAGPLRHLLIRADRAEVIWWDEEIFEHGESVLFASSLEWVLGRIGDALRKADAVPSSDPIEAAEMEEK